MAWLAYSLFISLKKISLDPLASNLECPCLIRAPYFID
jgi:hypothetical protein